MYHVLPMKEILDIMKALRNEEVLTTNMHTNIRAPKENNMFGPKR